jgi:hypothetical protein
MLQGPLRGPKKVSHPKKLLGVSQSSPLSVEPQAPSSAPVITAYSLYKFHEATWAMIWFAIEEAMVVMTKDVDVQASTREHYPCMMLY